MEEEGEEVRTMSAWVPWSLVVPTRERVRGGGVRSLAAYTKSEGLWILG